MDATSLQPEAPTLRWLINPVSGLPRLWAWIKWWFVMSWALIDETRDRSFGAFERGVVITAAIGLVVMHFFGGELYYFLWYGQDLKMDGSRWYILGGLLHWVGFCVVGYMVVPALYLKATGRRVRDIYLGWSGTSDHLRTYAVLYLLVMAPVVVVSFFEEYQAIYPFYPWTGRSWTEFVVWELAYGLQFVALEFFFRGFLLEGLRRALGHAAIFVMLLPYCMVHFQKTWTESLGSLIAGIILGTMAMRFRSIWGGAMLHWGVAISMDMLSLLHKGEFPPPTVLP